MSMAKKVKMLEQEREQWQAELRAVMGRERAQIEAARAADKARIAELEAALKNVKRYIQSGPHGAHPALEAIAAIDAALAQQGKEGEA